MNLELVLLIVFAVWLLALSLFFVFFYRFVKKLVGKNKEDDFVKILDRILKVQGENSGQIEKIQKEIKRIDWEAGSHIQKVGVVRFNPFKEIGGDHSFSLSLLDGDDSGVVITSLHTRERTRVYMKAIKNGKCELDLSLEEKKALDKAIKT